MYICESRVEFLDNGHISINGEKFPIKDENELRARLNTYFSSSKTDSLIKEAIDIGKFKYFGGYTWEEIKKKECRFFTCKGRIFYVTDNGTPGNPDSVAILMWGEEYFISITNWHAWQNELYYPVNVKSYLEVCHE